MHGMGIGQGNRHAAADGRGHAFPRVKPGKRSL
jgi:hypothetical protein